MKLNLTCMAAALAVGILVAPVILGPYGTVNRVGPGGSDFLQSTQLEPGAVATLRRACGNCHSNQTEWPWYSRVPPVSWLLRKHVSQGRKFLNFSVWPQYGTEGQGQLLALAATELEGGSMPPFPYSALHKEARLGGQERSDLIALLKRESGRLLKRKQENDALRK